MELIHFLEVLLNISGSLLLTLEDTVQGVHDIYLKYLNTLIDDDEAARQDILDTDLTILVNR